jgi:23S rRNA pseudouridine2457 synthase
MIYIALNKPFQVLSQFKEQDDKLTLKEFIKFKEKPKAVGRLDYDSEGLLLLSNDNSFIYQITSPKNKIEKEYYVQLEGEANLKKLKELENGIQTKTETYLPAKVNLIEEPSWLWERNPPIRVRNSIPTFWASICVREGKNRMIRKMTAFIGFPTLRLIRYRIGKLKLDSIPTGKYILIQKKDV